MQILSNTFKYLSCRGFFYNAGFYYPVFFFQLDSIQHGISVSFSFYSVRSSIMEIIFSADRTTSL
jgi:hypothetical protein